MHRTTKHFWKCFGELPDSVQQAARERFALLKANPRHPSLHFKKVGRFWSARVDASYRALAVEDADGFIWVWIGGHDEYERLICG
jgi:hypothetical protein